MDIAYCCSTKFLYEGSLRPLLKSSSSDISYRKRTVASSSYHTYLNPNALSAYLAVSGAVPIVGFPSALSLRIFSLLSSMIYSVERRIPHMQNPTQTPEPILYFGLSEAGKR